MEKYGELISSGTGMEDSLQTGQRRLHVKQPLSGEPLRRRFGAWWIVQSRLDRLHADGLISLAGYRAVCRFRDDVSSAGTIKASSWERLGVSGAGDAHGQTLGRLAAVKRLRAARGRLGAGRYALVYWVVAEDLPWAELARRLGVSDGGTAKRAAARAIARLDGA